MKRYLLAVFLIISPLALRAAEVESTRTPYYASLKAKAEEANVRTGPSVRYPIRWVYQRPNWPVQVVATFEAWRKIRDVYGEAGWVHKTLLTPKRHVLIQGKGVQQLFRLPVETASVVVLVEEGVAAELISCKSGWCKIEVDGYKGWIQTPHLWGVDSKENMG